MNFIYGLLRFFIYSQIMAPFNLFFSQMNLMLLDQCQISRESPNFSRFGVLLSLPIFFCLFMATFRLRFARWYIFCGVTILVSIGCIGTLWLVISDDGLQALSSIYIVFVAFHLLLARCCCEIGPRSPRCPAEGGGTTGGEACGGGGQGAGGV